MTREQEHHDPPNTDEHDWRGFSEMRLTAEQAALYGMPPSPRMLAEVSIIDIVCRNCRRNYLDVASRPCPAGASSSMDDRAHLIGGPSQHRKARTHTHDCTLYGCAGGGIPPSTLRMIHRQHRKPA